MGKHKSEKRARNVVSSDEDDEPDTKNQKNDSGRDDEFDNLFDAEEREKLNQMSEKDRETEIFKRIEMNQILKTREEIKKKLDEKMTQKSEDKKSNGSANSPSREQRRSRRAAESSASGSSSEEEDNGEESSSSSSSSEEEDSSKEEELKRRNKKEAERKKALAGKKKKAKDSSDEDSDDEDFDTEFHRPSELVEKSNKKKAMDVLLSKRRDKKEAEEKRKQKQKAALDIDEIFGDDDEDSKSGSSSSSSSSPASSRDASPEPKPEITSIGELLRCSISRFRLAQNVHAPFFKELAIGCFVRIGIGNGPDGTLVYRMAQIIDVVETAKIYQVEKTRTNKGLRLKHGGDERVYRLEFISNSEITLSEFQHWMKAMKNKGLALPTVDFVERKEKDIKRYSNYTPTNADIDYMVKEKMKFSKSPSNFAFQKGELLKAKEYAEQSGDFPQVQELQQKIDALDARAEQLDRQRSEKLSVVTWINQRNRDHMKQSFLGTGVTQMEIKAEDDPFTRKSGKMRVVSGKRVSTSITSISTVTAAAIGTLPADGLAAAASSLGISTIGISKAGDSLFKAPSRHVPSTSSLLSVTSKTTVGTSLPSVHDLFSAHDIEIDIPIKMPTTSSTLRASGNSSESGIDAASGISKSSTSRPTGSRTISIEQYKKKYLPNA